VLHSLLLTARSRGGGEVIVLHIFETEGTLSIPDMALWNYVGKKSWEAELSSWRIEMDADPRVPHERHLDHFVHVANGCEEPEKTACGR